MPSSTSSSDERLPAGRWGRTWTYVFLVVVPLLVLYEGFWRWRGFVPSVADNADLWILTRGTVRPRDRGQVVLLGASRMQYGLDPATFADSFGGRRPVQLAAPGSNCLPVLEHLGRQDDFAGVVLCELVGENLTDRVTWAFPMLQDDYVRRYENRSAVSMLEGRLRLLVQSHTVSRLGTLSPKNVFRHLLKGELPRPGHTIILPDRSGRADFSRFQFSPRPASPPPPWSVADEERLRRTVGRLEETVRAIRDRGGDVVFVRFPAEEWTRQAETAGTPKSPERGWQVLAGRGWARCIDFADYPSLSRFHCPDGSHLDYRDAAEFTRALAPIVREKLSAGGAALSRR